MSKKLERGQTQVRGFKNPEVDFQLMRMLGSAVYGGASIGECLSIVPNIPENDTNAWVEQYSKLADHNLQAAKKAQSKKHFITARELYLKASNYYRSAEYYQDPFSDLQQQLGLKARKAFLASIEYLPYSCEALELPFEGMTLPGYFLKAHESSKPNKTVMIISGFDGSAEESYFQGALGALQRGLSVLLIEGPGQTGTLRLHPSLKFRPDYEVPISAWVDYAVSRPEIDNEHLGLYGISFGGYFAARAAAFDKRIKALICNSPIIDLHAYMMAFIGEQAEDEDVTPEELSQIPDEVFPKPNKIGFAASCFKFGATSLHDYLEKLKPYEIKDSMRNIHCPTLAMISEGEGAEPIKQAETFTSSVAGTVDKYLFTSEEGADAHCQLGNLALSCGVAFDWFNDVFSKH